MFDITREDREIILSSGEPFTHASFYVVSKVDGSKVFPESRKHGYSKRSDAERGAAHIYRNWTKKLEKELLSNE